jgi:hypothetical protein
MVSKRPRTQLHECTVCQSGFVDTCLVPCGHFFHGECMMRWLQSSDSCPICQVPISKFVEATALINNPSLFVEINTPAFSTGTICTSGQDLPLFSRDSSKRQRRQPSFRRGKWSPEESAYAGMLVEHFKTGILPLANGTTLRAFLAKLLQCDPMR